jgi:hypothetical protein
MLQIAKEHLEKFEEIKRLFHSKTKVPVENNWRSRTNNEIWLEIVAQVVVVGRSEPWEKLKDDDELLRQISYEKLVQIQDQGKLVNAINNVLLKIGARYASSDISKSVKAKALAHNLNKLKSFEEGPKGFMKQLADIKGPDGDRAKIQRVMNNFMYIKNKGARDLLMELGVVRNAIALDARIQAIFQKVGVQMPNNFSGNSKIYEEIENDILNKICAPLGLLGVEFDRMLYQNYVEIMKINY